MSKIKLSDYIAKRLKETYGVERVFLVTGGGAMHLNDSFGKYIPYTCNHNEQACAFAAEGYARINQKMAVVNITTGPGGLNCLNGLFGQWTDSVPVLYISGQVKTRTMAESFPDLSLRQLGDQEVDIISIVKPLTKYAVTVTDPNEIKYHLDRAVYEANNGRKGPVWLNIPIDIQAAMIEEENTGLPRSLSSLAMTRHCEECNDEAIHKISNKLQTAKRPLIVAGHGIRLAGMVEEFKKLVNKLKIPVVTTFNGMDLLDKDFPYYVGRIGTIGQRAGNFALQNADLVLFLGTRNNIRQVSYNWENFAKNAYKIAIDIDKAELDKPLVIPDMKIHADLADFIPALNVDLEKDYSHWLAFCKNLKEKYSFKNHPEHEQKAEINPYYFIKTLLDEIKQDDVLVCANGTATVATFQVGELNGERVIMNSGDASMGFALPAAIGAYYQTKGQTVCLEGDGSIMMNIQELQTIIHNNLPIKIFVINNSGYSSIRQSQRNFFNGHMTGSGIESGVSVPDFVKVASAFGLKTKKITFPQNMQEEILEVLNTEGPVLSEVITEKDYIFAPKLSARTLPDGTMISPSLEDMYPFLDREEFEKNIIY